MIAFDKWTVRILALVLVVGLATSCGFRRKKYENPISKDTQQPDKVLFDKAVKDMEKGRYEIARLTLQTLMNTYDTSEYLAKSKLAYADSWFREGGSHGLAQAEAEYKDFILFYPALEEAAEAQEKVCMIHYKQMEKPDRDPLHSIRAEDECRNLLVQFPNSKFAPRVEQTLRNIQEVIAEGEFRRGAFYFKKGSFPAAANRLHAMSDHYPLYSRSDEANWLLGEAYSKMPVRFRQKAADAYAKIVRDYPLSAYAEEARRRLQGMEMPIPEADPVAYARMKFELENRDNPGMTDAALGIFKSGPDVRTAAKSGTPAMTSLRPTIPVSVPVPGAAGGSGGFTGDVTGAAVVETGGPATGGSADTGGGASGTGGGTAGSPAQEAAPAAGTAGAAEAAPAASGSAGDQSASAEPTNEKNKKDKGKKKKQNKKT